MESYHYWYLNKQLSTLRILSNCMRFWHLFDLNIPKHDDTIDNQLRPSMLKFNFYLPSDSCSSRRQTGSGRVFNPIVSDLSWDTS